MTDPTFSDDAGLQGDAGDLGRHILVKSERGREAVASVGGDQGMRHGSDPTPAPPRRLRIRRDADRRSEPYPRPGPDPGRPPGGGNILTQRLGPLAAWAWLVILTVIVGGVAGGTMLLGMYGPQTTGATR